MKQTQNLLLWIFLFFALPYPSFAATVELTPTELDAACSDYAEITISGLPTDVVIVGFSPGPNLWYTTFTADGTYDSGSDGWGVLLGFSDTPGGCGTQAPDPIFGDWVFGEFSSTTWYNIINGVPPYDVCTNSGSYTNCAPWLENESLIFISNASDNPATTFRSGVQNSMNIVGVQISTTAEANLLMIFAIFGCLCALLWISHWFSKNVNSNR